MPIRSCLSIRDRHLCDVNSNCVPIRALCVNFVPGGATSVVKVKLPYQAGVMCTVKNKLPYETTCGDVWTVFSSVDETVESNVKGKLLVGKCYEYHNEAIFTGMVCAVKSKLPYGATCVVEKCTVKNKPPHEALCDVAVKSKLPYEALCDVGKCYEYHNEAIFTGVICTVKSKLPYGANCVVEKCFEAVFTGVICNNICVILCEAICAGEVWGKI